MPPLANSGLCLAIGATQGGIGSFLLFFANFLSILLVAASIFFASGMAREYGKALNRRDFSRRFGLAIVGFVVVAIFLSHSLVQIVRQRQLQSALQASVHTELADMAAAGLDKLAYNEGEGKVHVFIQVHTPRTFSPSQVKRLQDKMTDTVGRPVELLVRSILTHDVSAVGNTNEPVAQDLDGNLIAKTENPILRKTASAEQILREYFLSNIGNTLDEIEYVPLPNHTVMLASVAGIRHLSPDEIRELESQIRAKTGDDHLELVIRYLPMELYDRDGKLRYGWWAMEEETPEIIKLVTQMKELLREEFHEDKAFHLLNTNATYFDGRFHFLLETTGAGIYPMERVAHLKTLLVDKFGRKIDLFVLSRPQVVVTPDSFLPLEEVDQFYRKKHEEQWHKEMAHVLEAAIY